jgi:hypothetical protein
MVHSSVLLYSSVPRNITVIYSSVPELRNIVSTDEHCLIHSSVNERIYIWRYIHRLSDKCTSRNRRLCGLCTSAYIISLPRAAQHLNLSRSKLFQSAAASAPYAVSSPSSARPQHHPPRADLPIADPTQRPPRRSLGLCP